MVGPSCMLRTSIELASVLALLGKSVKILSGAGLLHSPD